MEEILSCPPSPIPSCQVWAPIHEQEWRGPQAQCARNGDSALTHQGHCLLLCPGLSAMRHLSSLWAPWLGRVQTQGYTRLLSAWIAPDTWVSTEERSPRISSEFISDFLQEASCPLGVWLELSGSWVGRVSRGRS